MPPKPLDYQPVAEQDRSPKRLLVRMAKLFVLIYLAAVAGFTAVNLLSPIKILPWPELFYGPAITVVSCFILFAAAVWISSRRDRREA